MLGRPDRGLLQAGSAAALCCFVWLALLPHGALGQTLQQLCDQQGLALFLRHYTTDLQQLPDWSDFANVDATDYAQTASQVFLPPGQHLINVSGTPYAGDVAFIYQARCSWSLLCCACGTTHVRGSNCHPWLVPVARPGSLLQALNVL